MTGSDEHLKPLCLFDLARDKGPHITEEEAKHLRECDGCKRILDVFASSIKRGMKQKISWRTWRNGNEWRSGYEVWDLSNALLWTGNCYHGRGYIPGLSNASQTHNRVEAGD